MHEDFKRNHEVKAGSDRVLGLVFATVFAIIGCLPLAGANPWLAWWWAAAAAFATVAWLRPAVLAPLNRVWTVIGVVLNRIVSPLVLGAVFFVVVAPTGLLMRALRKDPLRLRLDRAAESYWLERRPPGPAGDSMRNQF